MLSRIANSKPSDGQEESSQFSIDSSNDRHESINNACKSELMTRKLSSLSEMSSELEVMQYNMGLFKTNKLTVVIVNNENGEEIETFDFN